MEYSMSPVPMAPMSERAEIKYAGFWRRTTAYVIDSLLIWIVFLPFNHMLGFGTNSSKYFINIGRHSLPVHDPTWWLFAIVPAWLYWSIMESSRFEATLGKMALGVIVIDENGNRLSWGRATGRHFGKFVSALTLGIGFMMAGYTERSQALHDKMASTLVVMKRANIKEAIEASKISVGYTITLPLAGMEVPEELKRLFFDYAGFWRRFFACIIDTIIMYFLTMPFRMLIGEIGIFSTPHDLFFSGRNHPWTWHGVLVIMAWLIVGWLYWSIMESSSHKSTLGKMALSIFVIEENGNRISFGKATAREFSKILSVMTYGIGFVMAAFTEKKQALHDKIAKTFVIMK